MKRIVSIRRGGLVAASVLLLLAAPLLLAGATRAGGGGPYLLPYVIGGGGGHVENGVYELDATIGQAVAGEVVNGDYNLCAGFWCGMGAYKVYLPLVMRQ